MINVIERELIMVREQNKSAHMLLTDIFEQLQIELPPQKDCKETLQPYGSRRLSGTVDTIKMVQAEIDYMIVLVRVLRDVIGYNDEVEAPMPNDMGSADPSTADRLGQAKVAYGPGVESKDVF